MDVSRLKIKGQLFTLKDPVSRDLANAASETANKAASDAATASNAAHEATVSANAANAKAEKAINEPPVKDISYEETTGTISIYLTNKEAQV